MLIALLSSTLAALLAPWLHRLAPRRSGLLLAVVPAALFGWFAAAIGTVAGGGSSSAALPWVPSLGVGLSFRLDGLSLLFALLILGFGALVLVYAGGYLAGHRHLGRFHGLLLLFMSSMLGLVLADNLMTMFVFWELTSLSSYLLIGFEYGRDASRKAALQALLVTGAGGLALLAGLLLLAGAGGSMEISTLLTRGDLIRNNYLYPAILILVLAGAFTKSAQFPFHFWLPSAMAAPSPVSAYLHSATMVKAGIFLLARFSPILGGTDAWHYSLSVTGAVTMLMGAFMAVGQKDLKRLLAYSTVSALGTLTLLLGLDTTQAAKAAMLFLLVHALYKGALFLAAGTVDRAAGTRHLEGLGGLRRQLPLVAAAAGLAALSMAGLPPMLGYIGKELLYEAKLHAPAAAPLVIGAGLVANVILVAAAGVVGIVPFFGRAVAPPGKLRRVPASLRLGPLVPAALGLAFGLFPGLIDRSLLAPAVSAVLAEPTAIRLSLWHGLNPVLLLSLVTYGSGAALFLGRQRLYRAAPGPAAAVSWGPSRWYALAVDGTVGLATLLVRITQAGYLRYYLMAVLGTAFLLIATTLVSEVGIPRPGPTEPPLFHEWLIAVLMLAAALYAATSLSRLATVAALGVVGYGVALIYIFFGAPDLAMTQFCVETLTVILFVLVLHRLPRFSILSGRRARTRDALIALGNGGVMTLLVLAATDEPIRNRISRFFAEHSLTEAHGRNVVNVILVDFRALDTLGEITVLAVAGLGVYALLGLAGGKGRKP